MKYLYYCIKLNLSTLLIALGGVILIYAITEMQGVSSFVQISLIFIFSVVLIKYTITIKPDERLNNYFTSKKGLIGKYKNISQLINRKHTAIMSCDEIQKDIIRTSVQLAEKLPQGYYRTITHESIIERLQKIYPCKRTVYLGRHSLRIPVYELMFPRCFHKCWWSCEKRKAKKDFYYIEFYVPAQEENGN